jgi:hypothetical protein
MDKGSLQNAFFLFLSLEGKSQRERGSERYVQVVRKFYGMCFNVVYLRRYFIPFPPLTGSADHCQGTVALSAVLTLTGAIPYKKTIND